MKLSEVREMIVDFTPEGVKNLVRTIKPALVKVMSFESQEYSYYVGSAHNLYSSRHVADLGLWHESLEEDD